MYSSILSIACFDMNGGPVCSGTCDDFFPSTSEYLSLAHLAGIPYAHLPCHITWNSMDGLIAFETSLSAMPRPVLVHSYTGYASSGLILLYLLKTGRLTCENVFKRAKAIDCEYWNDPIFVQLASQLSVCLNCCREIARSFVQKTPSPTWANYWQAKRLSGCVYIAGQIQRDHICEMTNGGFHTVANLRLGTRSLVANEPSQEEVTLLNVESHVLYTYQSGGRQLRPNLLDMRLDPRKPNSYVSNTSRDNFESKNVCEFGDEIGYNETIEHMFLVNEGINYHHLPGLLTPDIELPTNMVVNFIVICSGWPLQV